MKIKNAAHVAQWRLCVGCGACAYGCPEKKVRLKDVIDDGIRPFVDGDCHDCSDCLEVCPGIAMSHEQIDSAAEKSLVKGWGPVLEVWEGHAADDELRFRGSSGGAASALALFCVEEGGMHGVLHTGADATEPWRNKTVLSTDRKAILERTGSRYSPASPCDGLEQIEKARSQCVFIGKPCDAAALAKTRRIRKDLDKNIGLTISIFCAGTPSTLGTLELLKKNGIDPSRTEEIRYRGYGWPGDWYARLRNEIMPAAKASYMESWAFLQKYRPFRCYLCPDGTGEFADISCGDPWYREPGNSEKGSSLLIVRTERGRQILKRALEAGYLDVRKTDPVKLPASQGNLLEKRKAIWGRLAALKSAGLPAPRLEGFSLFENWLELPIKEKARSFGGTLKRIIIRRYRRPALVGKTDG